MKKLKTTTKVIIIIPCIIALVFGIVSLVWVIRYNMFFKPLLENDKLVAVDNDDDPTAIFKGYEYDSYYVSAPVFLRFAGSAQ